MHYIENIVLSIIVPTYNERENIPVLLERIDRALKGAGISYEVIVVDDNSPDGTADIAEQLSKVYPVGVVRRPGKLGLASAIVDGIKASQGRIITVMDADLQHPPEVLPGMFETLVKQGCDVVVASRYIEGGSIVGWSLLRKVVSRGATLIARVLLPKVRSVKDTMSGYFMFRREVVESILDGLRPRGYKILLEILVRGNVRKVCEIPYTFYPRYKGRSKLDAKEIINYLLYVLDLTPEYVRFAIVGAAGTVVNLGILALLRYLLGVPHAMASAIAIEASVINNFVLNDIWTFRRRGSAWWRKFLKFHASSATAVLVQWLVSNIVYYAVLSSSILAQLLGILAGFILNYMISKKFVWSYHS